MKRNSARLAKRERWAPAACLGGVIVASLFLAGCGPKPVTGPLTAEEEALVGNYYRPVRGTVPDNEREIKTRMERASEGQGKEGDRVGDLKKRLNIPRHTLSLSADRSYTISFGEAKSSGVWWAKNGMVTLLSPKAPTDRNPLSTGMAFRYRVGANESLEDIEGAEPYIRDKGEEAKTEGP